MRLDRDTGDHPSNRQPDSVSLIERLLAEQDQVIIQLDQLDLRIQGVIAAQTAPASLPSADAA